MTRYGQRPHLKAMGVVNVTKNFYLLGGVDDFISNQSERSGFAGAGFRLVDDDIKSMMAGGGGKYVVGR